MLELPFFKTFVLLLQLFTTPADKPVSKHLTDTLGTRPRSCISTIFGTRTDKWAGGNALYLGRPVNPKTDIGIAHRTLPVGSLVVLQNPKNDRWVVATVIDRGPYGAMLGPDEVPREGQICRTRKSGRKWCVKMKRSDPGRWRGCVDTTPRAAQLLGHTGYQKIRIWAIPHTKPASVWDWPAYKEKGKKRRERLQKRREEQQRIRDRRRRSS